MMTVTIREHTARQLTKVADEQATSPEALVEKAIRELLRAEANRILSARWTHSARCTPCCCNNFPKSMLPFDVGS